MGLAIHPLLAARRSPTMFDPTHVATAGQVEVMLDAARWAPSAGNSQPWAFLVGLRGDAIHHRLIGRLARSSAAWAPGASILVANLTHRLVEDTDWEYSEFASYDLGQAVAHMTFQALALGLSARQFRAFDRAGIEADFAVPPHWEVTTMSAFGTPSALVEPGEQVRPDSQPERRRRALDDIRWPGAADSAPWPQPSSGG